VIIETLTKWAPTQLITANRSASSIKSVEKAIRILLVHLSRVPAAASMSSQIADALAQQAYRMERAAADERARRAAHPANLPLPASGGPSLRDGTPNPTPPPQAGPSTSTTFPTSDERKRSAPPTAPPFIDGPVDKKPRLASSPEEAAARELLLAFDFSTLPVSLVTDLVVDNLQRLSETELTSLVAAYRAVSATALTTQGPAVASSQAPIPGAGPSSLKKEETPEPEQPLAVPVIDTEEMEYEPDKLNAALTTTEGSVEMEDEDPDFGQMDAEEALLKLAEFKMPLPKEIMDEEEREKVVRQVFGRLWRDVEGRGAKGKEKREDVQQMGSAELWLLLVVRLVSRTQTLRPISTGDGSGEAEAEHVKKEEENEEDVEWEEVYERQDRMRRMLCDFVLADFAGRVGLATAWMNEEWYNDRLRKERDRNFVSHLPDHYHNSRISSLS
jgi:symplekin